MVRKNRITNRGEKMNRIFAALLMVMLSVAVVNADSLEGKWTICPYYAPIYEFNGTFLAEVFDDCVAPGIADTNIMGVSFDYAKTETTTISLSFAFGENDIRDVNSRTVERELYNAPPEYNGWDKYTWDVAQDIDFKAFTVSALKRINPQNRVVPYLGIGIGVCQISGSIKGDETRETYMPGHPDGVPYEWSSAKPETYDVKVTDYDNTFSDIYPVLDARIGIDWHVTEKFILSIEERFVNGLGTMIVGKIVF